VNENFEGVPYETAVTGAPILPESIAWYDCRVEATHDGGDHLIIIARVVAIGFGDEARQPLLYYANCQGPGHREPISRVRLIQKRSKTS
jgi:3-hydroxy-9,10-secoandrosta-1,3,5(10)-triene-9,17-dione monooxygenase reductase component